MAWPARSLLFLWATGTARPLALRRNVPQEGPQGHRAVLTSGSPGLVAWCLRATADLGSPCFPEKHRGNPDWAGTLVWAV